MERLTFVVKGNAIDAQKAVKARGIKQEIVQRFNTSLDEAHKIIKDVL